MTGFANRPRRVSVLHMVPAQLLRVALLVLLGANPTPAQEEEGPTVIEPGRRVSIEYTLTLDDGVTADSNVGDEPLVYEHGKGQILPALEQSLEGLQAKDTKQVTLPPEEGYGEVDPEAFQTVPAEMIPEGAREAGAQLVAESQDGSRQVIRVHEVKESEIVLDMNHPLAGKTLHFDIVVLGVE